MQSSESLDRSRAPSLMKSYLDTKLKSLKRELAHVSDDESRKRFVNTESSSLSLIRCNSNSTAALLGKLKTR